MFTVTVADIGITCDICFARSQLFGCNNKISSRYFWYLLIVRRKMATWFRARKR